MTTDVLTRHDTAQRTSAAPGARRIRPVAWAARALAAARRRRRVAASVRALQALDDRTLNDIGVPRISIRDVVAGLEHEGRRRR